MARITASVFTSHVPAIGAAMDMGKTQEAYWAPLFKGYDFSRQWMKDNKPDPPTKAGARAPCPRWSAIPIWPATLPSP